MRLLLDECVDQELRHSFEGHDCRSAGYAGLAGLKNGALLSAAEAAGFEVMITTDQETPYQQNLRLLRIAIVILRGTTNRLADLILLVPDALVVLKSNIPGQVTTVGKRG